VIHTTIINITKHVYGFPQCAIAKHYIFPHYKNLIAALGFNYADHRQVRQHDEAARSSLFN
jgi:hypothetical protein